MCRTGEEDNTSVRDAYDIEMEMQDYWMAFFAREYPRMETLTWHLHQAFLLGLQPVDTGKINSSSKSMEAGQT